MSPGAGSYLIVDGVGKGDPNGKGALLARALERTGADVRLIASDAMPADLLGFQSHDLVILQNVPADAVSEESQHALAAHVRDMGGGLIMVGGPYSFGSGGWAGTPIEPMLPVRLDLAERLVERRTAIVLVLDGSGSMSSPVGGSFKSQQEIANAAAAAAARSLGSTDLVGVIRFSSSATWVRELGPNDDTDATTEAIQSISSGGGTNIPPALVMAGDALRDVKAAVKHIIVLSDGRSSGEAVLPELCQRLADEGINVSTISVGDAADTQTMFAMAQRGGGVHYPVTNPNVLPRVFVRAVRLVRDPLIKEGEFIPVALPTGSPALTGLEEIRPLEGLVLTRFREEPTVTNALATPEGEPVLSHWSAGLGRVAAFTSDASTWAAPWLRWSGYDVFWSQLARLTARPPAGRGFELTTDIETGRLRIRLSAFDSQGEPIDGLLTPAVVYAPDGTKVNITLEQVAPGEYAGSAPAMQSGNYIAVIKPRNGTKALPPVLGGATQASSIEYRALRSNTALLERIATVTGGKVLAFDSVSAADLYNRERIEPRLAESSLWRVLLVLSIITMLLDVATRRIAWDRYLMFRRPALAQASERSAHQTLGLLRRATAKRKTPKRSAAQVESDAKQLAIEARRRRQEARLREVQSNNEQEDANTAQQPEPSEEPESGLLAAKRRARERFEQDR
ncbi:MAG TPA: VWA domain-containing protein [Phycisphaerales bacterium]|nr:VWA domain-containing protein [Phycisphaerales bacterium]